MLATLIGEHYIHVRTGPTIILLLSRQGLVDGVTKGKSLAPKECHVPLTTFYHFVNV